jgi:hypothetical protein
MCTIIWGQVGRGVHVFNNLGPGGQGECIFSRKWGRVGKGSAYSPENGAVLAGECIFSRKRGRVGWGGGVHCTYGVGECIAP